MQNCIINLIYVTQLDDLSSLDFIKMSIYDGSSTCNPGWWKFLF